MRIAISTLVTPARKSGIGNYVVNLLESLQLVDNQNEYFIFVGKDTGHLFNFSAPNFHVVHLPFSHDPRWLMRPSYFLWQNSLIYVSLKKYKIDVLHLPNLVPLIKRYVPTVVTIPDLAEFSVARYSGLRQKYRKLLPKIISVNSDKIITISKSTKNDIIRITGCKAEKITVTHLAASYAHLETEHANPIEVLKKYGLTCGYILHVGGALPHKNLSRLLDAFTILKEQYHIQQRLVLVGDKGRVKSLVTDRSPQWFAEHEIIITGYVADNELVELYRAADVFVFPSLYEGFGLPVLEAMSYGTPVVTSNVSSLPEVAGDAALMVDPTDTNSIVQSILSILQDEALRKDLVHRGKHQSARFSWEKCATQTVEVYQQV